MPIRRNRNKPTGTVSLDEFLNSKSIFNLQVILSFWSPRPRPWHSKSALIRDLRRLMLDDKLLRQKLKELSPTSLLLLRCLVKQTPCDRGTYESMCDVEELADRGLVDLFAAKAQSLGHEHNGNVFPEGMRARLVEALDIDMRPVGDVFTLKGFLEAMPDDQYEQVVAPALEGAPRDGTRQTDYTLLTDTRRVLDGLLSLPGRLKDQIMEAVDNTAGLRGLASIKASKPAELREALESRLIGTVTELPMGYVGMGGPGIVIFIEITEKLLSIPPEHPHQAISNSNVDALVDINTILQYLSLDGARVKQDGTVYRSSLKRLAALMCPSDTGPDPDQRVKAYLSFLRKLGLAAYRHGEVVPTEHADGWLAEEPEQQLNEVIQALEDVLVPMNPYAWEKLMDVLEQFGVGEAPPANKVLSRLLLLMVKDIAAGTDLAKRLYGLTSLDALFEMAAGWMQALEYYGAIGIHGEGDAPQVVELTELGALALGAMVEPPPRSEADRQVLIVNPDFECIVFMHGPAWRVAAVLARFAQRQKTDQTCHLKITRRHVETAVLCGMSADSMIAFLREHSRTPIPQNVEYSINDWAAKVRVARSFSAIILETRDPETLDIMMEDDKVKPHVERRLAPTLAVLKDRISDKKLINYLRQNGVFLRS